MFAQFLHRSATQLEARVSSYGTRPFTCVARRPFYIAHRQNSTAPSRPNPSSAPPKQNDPNALPSFNLFTLLREARPATRYTVYTGLGVMATVESIFWFNVLKAKFFSSKVGEEQQKADEFLGRLGEAVEGYRRVYLGNYGRYYGGYVWGVGER